MEYQVKSWHSDDNDVSVDNDEVVVDPLEHLRRVMPDVLLLVDGPPVPIPVHDDPIEVALHPLQHIDQRLLLEALLEPPILMRLLHSLQLQLYMPAVLP